MDYKPMSIEEQDRIMRDARKMQSEVAGQMCVIVWKAIKKVFSFVDGFFVSLKNAQELARRFDSAKFSNIDEIKDHFFK